MALPALGDFIPETARQRRTARCVPGMVARSRTRAVPAPGGGGPSPAGGRERGPVHAHGFGQVARGRRGRVRHAGPGAARHLHGSDKGLGEREVLRADRGVRSVQRRHGHRRRLRQRRRAGDCLHRGDPGSAGPAVRCRHCCRSGGYGRVPLLRRPGSGMGLAGAVAAASESSVPAHVGHSGRHDGAAPGPDRPHRPRHRPGGFGRAPGPPRRRVPRDAAARLHRGTAQDGAGAGVHRAFHPEGGHRPGPEPHQPEGAQRRAEGRGQGGGGRFPLRHAHRQGPAPLRAGRHRRASRRDAAQVPAAGREAGPAGPSEADLRYGHPREWG